MMTLNSYLAHAEISQVEFAAIVGVKQPTVHRWLNGAQPSWKAAARIEDATGGKVAVGIWAKPHCNSPSSTAPLAEAV